MTAPLSEIVYLYGLLDLPSELRTQVPMGSPLEACLFYVARGRSPAIHGMFAAVPEPSVIHVDEGMTVARIVCAMLRSSRLLGALGSESHDSMGFHSGDRMVVERALSAAGATLVPLSTLLAQVAFVTIEPEAFLGAHDVVVERWVGPGTIGFSLRTPIEGTTMLAIPLVDVPTEAWTLIDGGGRHVEAESLRTGGSHSIRLALPTLPTLLLASPDHAAAAAAILADVYRADVVGTQITSSVEVGEVIDGHVVVTISWQQQGEVFYRMRDDVRLLSSRTPFDAERYRACIAGTRLALEAAASVRTCDVVPLVLYDDVSLHEVEAFRMHAMSPHDWASAVGRANHSEWQALGVGHLDPQVLGLLSPQWAKDAYRFGFNSDTIIATHLNVLGSVAVVDELPLAKAAAFLWIRWLLSDEVDAPTGLMSHQILPTLLSMLGPDGSSLVDHAVAAEKPKRPGHPL